MTEKEILNQIENLNKQEKFPETIRLVEGLGDDLQTPQILCGLGRAYLGLDRAGAALECVERVLADDPGDENARTLAGECRDKLTLPMFEKPFAQRIADGWERFAAGEGELRRLISEKADSDSITGLCHELLSGAFADVCFEVGFNGEKFDLILSPEKDKLMLFLLDAFKKRAPQSVTEHWNILLGRQAARDKKYALGFMGRQVALSDVIVRTEQRGNCFAVVGYSVQLAPLLAENRGHALWFFDLLLDMTLGEIVNMRYIDIINLEEEPFEGTPLLELPVEMEKLFGENEGWNNAESYLESFSGFRMEPREFAEDEYPVPRLDAFIGVSALPQLMFEYLDEEVRTINKAERDGAAAGFIFFPTDVFEDDETAKRGEKILNFRDELMRYLEENTDGNFTFIGGASGIYNCYLDFLAWDLKPVLNAAAEFFKAQEIVQLACYQSYRQDARGVVLWDRNRN